MTQDPTIERIAGTTDAARDMRPKVVTGVVLVLIHVAACAAFLPMFFTWQAVAVAAALFYLTGGIGICLGFHRLLTHRSMNVPKPLEYAVALLGTLALQGGPIEWISTHRAHHAFSDTERDPHDARKGFLWSHMTWLVAPNPARLTDAEELRFAHDLAKVPFYRFLEKSYALLQVALGLALFVWGGWPMVVWGIFVRLVVTYHVTWLVNSASHSSGYQTYDAKDLSTNNWLVAVLGFGEGWHNNHHAFPSSARHGMRWYEFDITWLTIKMLGLLKLADNIKVPTEEMRQRRRSLFLKSTPPANPGKTAGAAR